ncbi:hypothetical protein EN829_061555 [Mesorhizobium sp. M00.F.Ca.ET.186.01.1.1]|nr:hypothetical protein EN829_061555 [Mesorhizobium sp. M00.F.Ca.ET.186.01.1.1]
MNTLIYRIRRIEEILGISLAVNKHFMDVCLAIEVYGLLEVQVEQRMSQLLSPAR